MGEIEQDYFF